MFSVRVFPSCGKPAFRCPPPPFPPEKPAHPGIPGTVLPSASYAPIPPGWPSLLSVYRFSYLTNDNYLEGKGKYRSIGRYKKRDHRSLGRRPIIRLFEQRAIFPKKPFAQKKASRKLSERHYLYTFSRKNRLLQSTQHNTEEEGIHIRPGAALDQAVNLQLAINPDKSFTYTAGECLVSAFDLLFVF